MIITAIRASLILAVANFSYQAISGGEMYLAFRDSFFQAWGILFFILIHKLHDKRDES